MELLHKLILGELSVFYLSGGSLENSTYRAVRVFLFVFCPDMELAQCEKPFSWGRLLNPLEAIL